MGCQKERFSVAGGERTTAKMFLARREAYDERVLGLGKFVERLGQEEELRQRLPLRLSLEEVVRRVGGHVSLAPAKILRRSTTQAVARRGAW